MKTLPKQISLFTEEELTSLREDFPVNHIQQQENDKARKMNAICGQKCLEQFEKLSRPGLWAKTFAVLLIGMEGWSSKKCRLTWKLKGTKYNRSYFQLRASVLPTKEIGFGLLLTPTATIGGAEHPEKTEERNRKYKNGTKWNNLRSQVVFGMLPTPVSAFDGRYADMKHVKGEKMRKSPSIATLAVAGMLPTPIYGDHKGSKKNRKGKSQLTEAIGASSQLNPRFVMEMMGFPPNWTELPFLIGEMSQLKGGGTL